ncbi:zinc transporter ZupT [Christensenellaceae bacterium OttesenSCG-928-L17]|nr:zinc transporter ZupT [Christensenellaceae bacterium OttesenSCG-928-L17]
MQAQAFHSLLLSLAAGLSTLIGALIVVLIKKKSDRLITAALGFAAGVMISVSFLDMYPNAQTALTNHAGQAWGTLLTVLALLGGVMIGLLLDKLVPHEEDAHEGKSHGGMYRLGMMSMLAIAVHNFPEGIATFAAGVADTRLGISVALAIALHNIPEGISVAMPVYFSSGNRKKTFLATFLSGISEPIGALLAYFFLMPFLNDLLLGIVFSIVCGIMLYIAIEELMPVSRSYGYPRLALASTFAGICLMPLTHILG